MIFGGWHRRISSRLFPTVGVPGNKGLTKRNGVAEMTAVVSRERARGAYLTGAAGLLMIAIACVMMVVAAPGRAAASGHGAGVAKPAAVRLVTDACLAGDRGAPPSPPCRTAS
jgi:hypothetical protein